MDIGKYRKVIGKYPLEYAVDRLDDYKYSTGPDIPTEIIKFAKQRIQDREFKMKDDYWKDYRFTKFFEELSKWRAVNRSNFDFLTMLYKKFKDTETTPKIISVLKGFRKLDKKGNFTWDIWGYDYMMHLSSFSGVPY